MNDKKSLTVRIPEKLYETVTREGKKQTPTRSAYVEKILENYLKISEINEKVDESYKDIEKYQKTALDTINNELSTHDQILNCCLGIAGESGEVVDLVKKHYFQGRNLETDKIIEEIGDVMWYIANLCTSLNVSLVDVLTQNVFKLQDRY